MDSARHPPNGGNRGRGWNTDLHLAGMVAAHRPELVRIGCRLLHSPITSRPDLALVPFAAGADTFGAVLAITSTQWGHFAPLGAVVPTFSSGEPQHDSTENRRPRYGQQRDQLS